MWIWCVVLRRDARGMIEWQSTQERLNPEVAIICGSAARCRRAAVGCSHDDAHPDKSTLHTGAVRSQLLLGGGHLLHIIPYGPRLFANFRNAASFFARFAWAGDFCAGNGDTIISVNPSRQERHLCGFFDELGLLESHGESSPW
jgi:hypothetical protein